MLLIIHYLNRLNEIMNNLGTSVPNYFKLETWKVVGRVLFTSESVPNLESYPLWLLTSFG